MATGKTLDGKPYAGNPHERFDEGNVAPVAMPRRGSLLCKNHKVLLFALIIIASTAYSTIMSSFPRYLEGVPVGWCKDYERARKVARDRGKLILLAFTYSGRHWSTDKVTGLRFESIDWSDKMKKEIYCDDKFVKQAKDKFVLVMFDISDNWWGRDGLGFANQFGVQGYPSTVIVRQSGEKITCFRGYQSQGIDAFLASLRKIADKAGVKGIAKMSDEDAKKDDRFFPSPEERAKITTRESKQRQENAQSNLTLREFAGIVFLSKNTDGKLSLKEPYRLLSEIRHSYYSGKKLTTLTLAAPARDVRKMSDEALRLETCKLVHTLEDDLGVRFAVTSSSIDFKSKKTQIIVRANKSAGELSVRIEVKE